jgi:hypothetical protein
MRVLLVSLLLALVSGCASVQPISEADRRQITSVSLSPSIEKAPQIYFVPPGAGAGLMFGAIGGALAAGPIEERRKAFQQFVESRGISIEKIAAEEVGAALRRSNRYPFSDAPRPGGSTLHVAVFQYGFSIPHGFSSVMVPIVALRLDMKDASGKLVWSATERILTLGNPVEGITPEAMQKDPQLIEQAWRASLRYLAAEIIKAY